MLIKIDKLGSAGMVADAAPHDLPSSAVSVAESVRFSDGKARKAKGYKLTAELGAISYPTWMQPWTSDDIQRFAIQTRTDVRVMEGTTILTPTLRNQANSADITLATSLIGQSTLFGNFCVLNNGVDYPLYSWNAATSSTDGTVFREIPGWGAANSPGGGAKVIRGFGSFLIAMGVADDPYSFYWSDEAEPGAFPQSWDYADPTNLAGRNTISAADGPLVNGEPLGNDFIIYTTDATYATRFVGGAFIFDTRRLWPWGCLNQDCVVQIENQHFVVANEAVFLHDGNTNKRIAAGRVERQLFAEITDLSKVRVASSLSTNEVLIYYPKDGSAYANRACVWNWLTDTWSFRDLPTVACITEGHQPTSGLLRFDSPEVATLAVDDAPWTIDELGATDPRRRLFMLTTESDPVFDVTGNAAAILEDNAQFLNATRAGTAGYYAYIERTGLDLENVGSPAARSVFVRGIYPQIRGSGVVQMQLGSSQSPNGNYQWSPVQSFDLDSGSAYKIDARFTGRYLGYRVGEWEGTPTEVNWELTAFEVDVQDGGR